VADAINSQFYGHFPYPWRPINFQYPASGNLASAMLSQNVGDWDHQILPPRPNIWVAGCGTNQAVQTALHFPFAAITGSDLSETSLELCGETLRSMGLKNVALRQESINSCSYDSQFDFVICTGVIHHNADPQATLQKLARALKPGGVMELMVYNRFHRLMNTAVQKAMRLLTGGGIEVPWEKQMALLRQVIEWLPEECEASSHLKSFQGQPDARIADSLLQPVEHSYTVESLSELARSSGLELVTYRVSEWDKADERVFWNMQWGCSDLRRQYDSLPDLARWQITNLLMFEKSPMLWFYLQRRDSGRPVKSEQQMAEEFLERPFAPTRAMQRCYTLQDDGGYKLSSRLTPVLGAPAHGIHLRLLESCNRAITMREAFERQGVTPSFEAATRARIMLTTSAFPFLTSLDRR
jgi:SAM-dependent methyltransferase